jgi:hypothetical protein
MECSTIILPILHSLVHTIRTRDYSVARKNKAHHNLSSLIISSLLLNVQYVQHTNDATDATLS